MKIKVKKLDYNAVKALPTKERGKPKKPMFLLKLLMYAFSAKDLHDVEFKPIFKNMTSFPDEPCLIIGNHSSFIDLEAVISMLFPKSVSIVCTSDAFVGKPGLMSRIGCIPINKFVSDPSIISDISFALKKNKTNVLIYPEASYTFDGCATPLPQRSSSLFKLLKVPVVMITMNGAFLRQPLYNCLKKRKVKVSATVEMLFSAEEVSSLSTQELDKRLSNAFSFDNFKYQQEHKIKVDEPFRADGIERILYKCPHCNSENSIIGKGTRIKCNNCDAEYELTEYGALMAINTDAVFTHIPDWYAWERSEVKKEITEGNYCISCDCRILVRHGYKAVYDIGKGHLRHDKNGFHLQNSDSSLDFHRSPTDNYGLYADYYWYEIGDMICIGNRKELYYCFPDTPTPVAKARLAAEEMYKIARPARK